MKPMLHSFWDDVFNIINDLIEKIKKKKSGITPPNYLGEIDYNEVHTILKAEFPDAWIGLSDSVYKTTTKEELMKYINYDIIDEYHYVSEYYDCDDFSYALMGSLSNPEWGALPFGIMWTDVPGGAHAVNCFIDNNREVWIIEPQTDQIFSLPKDWSPYFIVM